MSRPKPTFEKKHTYQIKNEIKNAFRTPLTTRIDKLDMKKNEFQILTNHTSSKTFPLRDIKGKKKLMSSGFLITHHQQSTPNFW